MQESRHISRSIFLGCLSLLMLIVIVAFERLFVFFQFSNGFKFVIFLLTGMGITFGALSVWNSLKIKSMFASVVKVASLIGVLLNVGLLCLALVAKPPEMTGTIIDMYSFATKESHFGYEHSLRLYVDLPANEDIEWNLNPQEPIFIVNTTANTLIYEQIEEGRTRMIDGNQLQENQHIKVEWDGLIIITEPAQVRAIRITVLSQ